MIPLTFVNIEPLYSTDFLLTRTVYHVYLRDTRSSSILAGIIRIVLLALQTLSLAEKTSHIKNDNKATRSGRCIFDT